MTEYVSLIVSTRETHLLNVTHYGLQCLSAFWKKCPVCIVFILFERKWILCSEL